jgi:hypothetical protein
MLPRLRDGHPTISPHLQCFYCIAIICQHHRLWHAAGTNIAASRLQLLSEARLRLPFQSSKQSNGLLPV